MRIVTAKNGKKSIKISKNEWINIGKKTGWIKTTGSEEYGIERQTTAEENIQNPRIPKNKEALNPRIPKNKEALNPRIPKNKEALNPRIPKNKEAFPDSSRKSPK